MRIEKIEDIKEKSFAKTIDNSFNVFVKDIFMLTPISFHDKWKTALNELEVLYKRMILENTKARSGIFLGQWKGTSIDDFIKEGLEFEIHREDGKVSNPSYTLNKFKRVCGFACTLHLRKYKRITDYAIKFIMMRVFVSFFDRYYIVKYEPDKKTGRKIAIKDIAYIGETDMSVTYDYLVNVDEHDLDGYDYELDIIRLMNKNKKKYGPKKNKRPKMPKTLYELTECLTGEEEGKMEQYEIISKHFGISQVCARKWMKILIDRENEARKSDFDNSGLFKRFEEEVTDTK